jgi:hypothetical protein
MFHIGIRRGMKSLLEPWHLLLLILAGWINHRQHYAIEYLHTETRSSKKSSARNASCSTITNGAVWQSRQDPRPEHAARGCHYRDSGYDPALASGTGGCQMGCFRRRLLAARSQLLCIVSFETHFPNDQFLGSRINEESQLSKQRMRFVWRYRKYHSPRFLQHPFR